jgi:hypothetical protein
LTFVSVSDGYVTAPENPSKDLRNAQYDGCIVKIKRSEIPAQPQKAPTSFQSLHLNGDEDLFQCQLVINGRHSLTAC